MTHACDPFQEIRRGRQLGRDDPADVLQPDRRDREGREDQCRLMGGEQCDRALPPGEQQPNRGQPGKTAGQPQTAGAAPEDDCRQRHGRREQGGVGQRIADGPPHSVSRPAKPVEAQHGQHGQRGVAQEGYRPVGTDVIDALEIVVVQCVDRARQRDQRSGPRPCRRAIVPRQEEIHGGNCRAGDDRRRRGSSEDRRPIIPGRPHRQCRGDTRGRLANVDQRNAVQIGEREALAARPGDCGLDPLRSFSRDRTRRRPRNVAGLQQPQP